MTRLLQGIATAGILLAFAGGANAEVHFVSIVDFAFEPMELTIAVGDSVHWTNDGQMAHTVTSGMDCTFDGRFDSGNLDPGDAWGHTFATAGDYAYFCEFHCPGMTGRILVEQGTPIEESTWGRIKGLYR